MTLEMPPQVVFPQAEALLEELGLTYKLEYVELSEIDRKASRQNQARITPIVEERAERYARAVLDGAVFPAGLIGRNGTGRLVIADSNHRDEAFLRAKQLGCWAYVFEYETEEQFRAVADTANARLNGAENTLEERLMHAVYAINNSGITRSAAEPAVLLRALLDEYNSMASRLTETSRALESAYASVDELCARPGTCLFLRRRLTSADGEGF